MRPIKCYWRIKSFLIFLLQMLIPRDVWELAATVPLPRILKTSSPSTPTALATPGEPLKPPEPVPSSLLQQSSAILLKSSAEEAHSQTTVEDWIAEAPWVEVQTPILASYIRPTNH